MRLTETSASLAEGIGILQQAQAPEARMALAADHQVIVDGDAQRLGCGLHLARHLDVVARRLGIATGVIVDQHCSERIALT